MSYLQILYTIRYILLTGHMFERCIFSEFNPFITHRAGMSEVHRCETWLECFLSVVTTIFYILFIIFYCIDLCFSYHTFSCIGIAHVSSVITFTRNTNTQISSHTRAIIPISTFLKKNNKMVPSISLPIMLTKPYMFKN